LNRPPHLHSDGSRKFISAADREREDRVARLVGREWGVELVRLPEMHVLDWYFKGHERLLGFAELKGRQHPRGRFPTVFLSLNKWLALLQAATHGKPSMFVACFTDCVCWQVVGFDMGGLELAGARHSDPEPCVEVPVESMGVVCHLPKGLDGAQSGPREVPAA
jgi:hypothetical protein